MFLHNNKENYPLIIPDSPLFWSFLRQSVEIKFMSSTENGAFIICVQQTQMSLCVFIMQSEFSVFYCLWVLRNTSNLVSLVYSPI